MKKVNLERRLGYFRNNKKIAKLVKVAGSWKNDASQLVCASFPSKSLFCRLSGRTCPSKFDKLVREIS